MYTLYYSYSTLYSYTRWELGSARTSPYNPKLNAGISMRLGSPTQVYLYGVINAQTPRVYDSVVRIPWTCTLAAAVGPLFHIGKAKRVCIYKN